MGLPWQSTVKSTHLIPDWGTEIPHATCTARRKQSYITRCTCVVSSVCVCVCACVPGSSDTPASVGTPSTLISTSEHLSPIKGARAPWLVVDPHAETRKAQEEKMSLEHLVSRKVGGKRDKERKWRQNKEEPYQKVTATDLKECLPQRKQLQTRPTSGCCRGLSCVP